MGNAHATVRSVIAGPYPGPTSKFFDKEYNRKNYACFPLRALMVLDILGGVAIAVWMICTREISIDRSKKPVNHRMSLLEPYYLRLLVQKGDDLQPRPVLHEIYQDMKRADEEKKRER